MERKNGNAGEGQRSYQVGPTAKIDWTKNCWRSYADICLKKSNPDENRPLTQVKTETLVRLEQEDGEKSLGGKW